MTNELAPRMRWWGWGVDGHDAPLPKAAAALVREELGARGVRLLPPALGRIDLPAPALPARVRRRLVETVGAEHVRDDRLTRVGHCVGRSYPDLLRLRSGSGLAPPDAIVFPAGHDEVAAVLAVCAQASVAVIPFGGGTSVVGGIEPLRGRFEAAITLDLARMTGMTALDAHSQLATFAAGTTGPELERLLGTRGLTLGHIPQSFEFSTVGGWAATRSAGQASTGYGRIDQLVVALRAATPSGELSPRPRQQRFDAYALPGFAAGTEALRALEQSGAAPTLARLSDVEETRISLALSPRPGATRALRGYMRARGRAAGCLTILGFDGDAERVARRRAHARSILRRHGAIALGSAPGAAWAKGRFHGAYVRDELMSRGVLIDTLETATTWTGLGDLHRDVAAALRDALAQRETPAVVMCHVSHLYPTGASLYFTYLARQQAGAEIEQWQAAKTAASDVITRMGATITHHHAVGIDHAPWLRAEVGELGVAALRAVKAQIDPAGVMNPGKLLA